MALQRTNFCRHIGSWVFLLLSLLTLSTATAFELPKTCKQAVVALSDGWNSTSAKLGLYERRKGGWIQVGQFWDARLGRNGLAWGLGMTTPPKHCPSGQAIKKEGDGRAPAGVFAIGGAYGYAPKISKQAKLPYHQITQYDLWVEDSTSPYYNRHLQIKHAPKTAWEKKQQMRQGDYAHALKLYIGHNTATAKQKAKPGAGSAIFFHIWRNEGKTATSGCTTMSPKKLRSMISQIDPTKNPVYILLPRKEYNAKRATWKLP